MTEVVPDEDVRLYLGGFSKGIPSKDEIITRFSRFGSVKDITVPTPAPNGRPTDFLHITLTTSQTKITSLISTLGGTKWKGSTVRIAKAKSPTWKRTDPVVQEEDRGPRKILKTLPSGFGNPVNVEVPPAPLMSLRMTPGAHATAEQLAKARTSKRPKSSVIYMRANPAHERCVPINLNVIKRQRYWVFKGPKYESAEDDAEKIWRKAAGTILEDTIPQGADLRRRDAMDRISMEQTRQGQIISRSIATDTSRSIKFDHVEPTDGSENVEEEAEAPKKGWLGDSDDEDASGEADYGDDFRIREEFEGKEGRNLLNLKKQFGTDERFGLDARFRDDASLDSKGHHDEQDEDVITKEELNKEKDMQLGVLASLMKNASQTNRVLSTADDRPQFKDMSKLRYDPSADNTKHFERQTDNSEIAEVAPKKRAKKGEGESEPPVDSSRFVTTTDDISSVFKNTSRDPDDNAADGFKLIGDDETAQDGADDGLFGFQNPDLRFNDAEESFGFGFGGDQDDDQEAGLVDPGQDKQDATDSRVEKAETITMDAIIPGLSATAGPRGRPTWLFTPRILENFEPKGRMFYRHEPLSQILDDFHAQRPDLQKDWQSQRKLAIKHTQWVKKQNRIQRSKASKTAS
eukprot:Clim_evm47s235 gene=Clim_evmTU47s235